MSKSGPFSGGMSMDEHFPGIQNGGGDNNSGPRTNSRRGGRYRNTRGAKSHRQNGQGSREETPSSHTPTPEREPEEKEKVQVEVTPTPEPMEESKSQPVSLVNSPEQKKDSQIQFDLTTTTDENFVTANNSAEESLNGNFESLPPLAPEDTQNGNGHSPTSGAGNGHSPASGAGNGHSPTSGAGNGHSPTSGAGNGHSPTSGAGNGHSPTSGGTLTPNNSLIHEDVHQGQDDKTLNDKQDSNDTITLSSDESLNESLNNASLAVNMSETAHDPSFFQSFMTEPSMDQSSLSTSPPLSTSRNAHAQPDLSTIIEQEQQINSPQNATTSIIYPINQNQFQTSTPICPNTVPSRRSVGNTNGNTSGNTSNTSGNQGAQGEMNFTAGEDPSTIYQEDPTYVRRANQGFVDYDDSSIQQNDLGQVTKESGICDMSTPTKDFKDADDDTDVAVEPHSSPESGSGAQVEPLAVSAQSFNNEVPKSNVSSNGAESLQVPVAENDPISDADEEVEEINKPFLLPTTVTELTAANGVKVYLVGTAHFSRQSQLDVIETMAKVEPSIVVLELCRSRSGMLTMNEEDIMREAADMSLAKIKATIKQTGPVQGLLHVLLLQMTASLTKKLGMAPGGEFRVAVQEAQKIPGCGIHFGDRALSVTLNRALSGLGFFQKVKLAWHFLKANDTDITKEEVEACKEKDLLEKLLVEMAGEFPSITRVLLDERDLYLANSLWLAATSTLVDRAGNIRPNTKPIVGVVGMGHVAGITRNWGPIDPDKMAEIVTIPEPPLSHFVIGKVVKYSCYTLIGFLVYKSSRKLFSFPSDALIESAVGKVSSTFQKIGSGKFGN